MNSNRIFGLPDSPTADNDATSKKYVDAELGISGTMVNNPSVTRNDAIGNNIYLTGMLDTTLPGNGVTARGNLYVDNGLYYNPSSNTLYATTFSGSLSGNATTATSATSATSATTAGSCSGNADTATSAKENTPFRIGQNVTSESGYLSNVGTAPSSDYSNTIALVVKKLSNTTKFRPHYRINGSFLTTGIGGNGDLGSLVLKKDANFFLDYGYYPFGGFPVAFFEGGIQTDYVMYGSDKRIKQNISEITDGTSSLQLLRRIKSSTFEYVDKFRHSPYRVHGFIAQDIKDIVPEAVQFVPDCLPSFYCMCSIEKYLIQENDKTETFRVYIPVNNVKKLIFTGNHDKKTGIEYKTASGAPASDASGNQNFKVKMKDSSDNDVEVITTQIIDDFSFLVKVKLNDKGENTVIKEDTYFLYGQYVDDFHKIDTEHIHNIATAALQEVDRQQQADKVRIAELEAKVAEQQSLINDILERLKKVGA